ncbi:uncharacterized protein LOC103191313 [Callorhinchus milii]|uniref:uncharacterized protein LOC103191313 n=1 Tax=Callorhinchus milii TaxID=7868 RepID=UPI001C3FBE0E|nr:uncharacterized protein LOC103191313 [Callorhinchus milii]
MVYRSIVHLTVFNVSVSADSSLTPGGRLALTCHIAQRVYSNPKPTIHTNGSITLGRIEAQWTHDGNVIINYNRHSLDLRSLNIRKLQHSDSGIYCYVFKIKCSTSSFQILNMTIPSDISIIPPTTKGMGTDSGGLNHWHNLGIRTASLVTLMIIFTFGIFMLFKRRYREPAGADSSPGQAETQDNGATQSSIPLDTLRNPPSVASSDRDQGI